MGQVVTRFYPSYRQYIDEECGLIERINRLDALVLALLESGLNAAMNQDVQDYTLNDGQTTIRVRVGDVQQIIKMAEQAEALKEFYKAQFNGRVFRLRDHEATRRYVDFIGH